MLRLCYFPESSVGSGRHYRHGWQGRYFSLDEIEHSIVFLIHELTLWNLEFELDC